MTPLAPAQRAAKTSRAASNHLRRELFSNRLEIVGDQQRLAAVAAEILKLVDVVIGLRVNAESEQRGLDVTDHGEEGYMLA